MQFRLLTPARDAMLSAVQVLFADLRPAKAKDGDAKGKLAVVCKRVKHAVGVLMMPVPRCVSTCVGTAL